MKRSEMIKLLDEEINKRCDYGTVFWDEDIDAILKVIEAAGMTPPVYYEDCVEGYVTYEKREWEKE